MLPKFKVGYRVRLIETYGTRPIGATGTVVSVIRADYLDENWVYGVDFDSYRSTTGVYERRLASVVQNPAPAPATTDDLRRVVDSLREQGYTVNVNFIAPSEKVEL